MMKHDVQRVSNSRTDAHMHHTGWISWVPVNRMISRLQKNSKKNIKKPKKKTKKTLKGISRLYGVMITIPGR